jgi:2,4-dienoyl-CoA reductase-like NADH-dependent reductase (Old Yellow Enzyme family)
MAFTRGPAWRNRFMLAPLTNTQSHADGTLSDEEFRWLTMRAKGGFGLVMTCAAHVQRIGQGFSGQLGVFSDNHLAGLSRLAAAIRANGAVSSIQLHHAGNRAFKVLADERPVGPSDEAKTRTRALSTGEVEQLTEDFIAAAVRAEQAGFDGVELHGAHGYILCAFQSPELNRREDRYGGSHENRTRLLLDVLAGVRARTRPDFQVGVRLSSERFGLKFDEQLALARLLLASGDVDYLDMSLWDAFKAPEEEAYAHRPLIDWFAKLPRGETRLGAAGKIMRPADARRLSEAGADFVILGRAAILHHDYPLRYAAELNFAPVSTPVTRDYLDREGVSPAFVVYLNSLGATKGYIEDEAAATEA